jgi:hypothetical protein
MRKKTILYILIVFGFMACQNDELITIGDDFIDGQTNVSLVDSISLKMSTFKIDSLETSLSPYLTVGSYTDEYFGDITSEAYFQLEMPMALIADDEIYDSIVIKLPYTGLSYGDTLLPQTINVHRVIEDIEPGDEYDDLPYLYNTSRFDYDPEILGSATIVHKPNFRDSLIIRLNDELGKEFLELLRDEDDEIDISSDFLDIFHGVALVPGNENNSILSFKADSAMKIILYTHIVEEEKHEKSYSFVKSDALNHCNNLVSDVSGTELSKLGSQKEEVYSYEMDEMTFLQGGTGIVTRIDFPGIGKILEVEYKNILYKAELVLKPVPGSFKSKELPASLILFQTDKYNNLLSQYTDDLGNPITSTLHYDEYYDENNYYTFDITTFIYNELSDGYVDPDNGLLVMLPNSEFYGTLDRLVFDTRSATRYRPILNLYYVFYN